MGAHRQVGVVGYFISVGGRIVILCLLPRGIHFHMFLIMGAHGCVRVM